MTEDNAEGIKPVRRLKVSDSVAAELNRLIERGDYAPGDKLPPERILADRFGVGRSSMREALRLVEASGLLRIEHGVGVFVVSNTRPSPTLSQLLVFDDFTVPDLFEVRLSIEGYASGVAAKRITPAEAEELRAILTKAEDPEISDDAFVRLDVDLHKTIVKATKNRILSQIFDSIEPLLLAYSHRVIQLPGRRESAQCGHREIVEAVLAGRGRDARNAAVRHIRHVERQIVGRLGRATEADQ
jgi:GntR family transcriptional repressor for pyruvate dehydrogenase complex